MALVENLRDEGPVKIGLGKRTHRAALYAFGAEKVYEHPEETQSVIHYSGIRNGDTVIVLQPKLLTLAEYKKINLACGGDVKFQVVGHRPITFVNDKAIDKFRELKAKGKETEIVQIIGRPKKIKYTVEQADAILRLWYEQPKRKPGDVKALAEAMLGLEEGSLSPQWVKDLAIKYTGSAKRTPPAGWNGIRID